MSVQYNGYSMMPNNLYDTFTSENLIQSIQQFKQFTSYIFQEQKKINFNILEQKRIKSYMKDQIYNKV